MLKMLCVYLKNGIGNNELILTMLINGISKQNEASVDSIINVLTLLNPDEMKERGLEASIN